MATAGAQYIIACYSSQAGTFGQKLICQGRRGGREGALQEDCPAFLI